MSAVNKVILIGNLGGDPEKRFLPSGGPVTKLSLATSEVRKNKSTGQPTEHTEWHRVVLFDRLADLASQYLAKGSSVYIEGKLRTRKWKAQNGTDKYTTEIIADEMQFLNAKNTKNEPLAIEPIDDASIPF